MAVGHDRPRLSTGEDRRPHEPRRAVGHEVEGQGRLPDRDARHDRPDDAQARQGPEPGDHGRTAMPPSRRSRRPSTPGSSGRSRATPTPTTSSRATSSCRWPGPATSSRSSSRRKTLKFAVADEGGMLWTDNMLIPKGAKNKYTAELMIDFCYHARDRRADRGVRQLHLPGQGRQGGPGQGDDPDIANNPLIFPPDGDPRQAEDLQVAHRGGRDVLQQRRSGRIGGYGV